MPRLLALLLCFLIVAAPVQAASKPKIKPAPKPQTCYELAFDALASNNPDQAVAIVAKGSDPVLNKVVRAYAMALPGTDFSFEEMDAFMAANPDWPGLKGIQMMAERKMPDGIPASKVIAWFSNRKPLTLIGFYHYVDALNRSGLAAQAQEAIRVRWIEGDFTADELAAFYDRFGMLLTGEPVWARADRLLWKNDQTGTRRMIPYLNATDRAVAEARLAFANQESFAEGLAQRLPSDARNDPGLLFQRLKFYVKNNEDQEAEDLLQSPPPELVYPEYWWTQRHIMVRRAMEKKDFALAYRLASNHGQTAPGPFVQAEFVSGWLALRFLARPSVALQHFQRLYDAASTPISRARGAYWLGRTYEELGDKNAAEQAYQDAAVFNTTYYGQLATTRIYKTPILTAKSDPPIPENVRAAFFARDNIRAAKKLAAIGEDARAKSFFMAAVDAATKRADFILLTELATSMNRPDLGIQAVKAANQKNMLVQNGGFPLIALKVPTPPEPAFTHALIRQESMFNPGAESGAGARGLMQLMPRTAKGICQKVGMKFSERKLAEPSYNILLGTTYINQQINLFDGSYVLALAAYNAGMGRVREWIDVFGDPRTGAIDPIDWVELIPVQETRNYVQRIIESLQVYRAKLAGGHSQLQIANDLTR